MEYEEWECPQCGLIGDYHRIEITDRWCKQCQKQNYSEEMYQFLEQLLDWMHENRGEPMGVAVASSLNNQMRQLEVLFKQASGLK